MMASWDSLLSLLLLCHLTSPIGAIKKDEGLVSVEVGARHLSLENKSHVDSTLEKESRMAALLQERASASPNAEWGPFGKSTEERLAELDPDSKYDKTLKKKDSRGQSHNLVAYPRRQFEEIFEMNCMRPKKGQKLSELAAKNILPDYELHNGLLSGYARGIMLSARHSPHASVAHLKLSTLLLDAWMWFFTEEKQDLRGFRKTVIKYRYDLSELDEKLDENKLFMYHLQNCWNVAVAMNPHAKPMGNTNTAVRMHEFSYAFILAFGYRGSIEGPYDIRASDWLDLVTWKNDNWKKDLSIEMMLRKSHRPQAPYPDQTERFKEDLTELGYYRELDLLAKIREILANDREIVAWSKADEEKLEDRVSPKDSTVTSHYLSTEEHYDPIKRKWEDKPNTDAQCGPWPHITEDMFTSHFMKQSLSLFSNLDDDVYRNDLDQDYNFLKTGDKPQESMNTEEKDEQELIEKQRAEFAKRSTMPFEEQQAEIEKYRQYLHLVFKAGVSMLPLHRVTRRRRSVAGVKVGRGVFWSEMDWISDPSFQYAAIAAHEFVWQDLRKSGPSGSPNASGSEINYGRDILMVVPKSLPDEYTIPTERQAQPLPDHLVSDLPKPQADTVRNILNRIEGYQNRQYARRIRKRDALDEEDDIEESSLNHALLKHFNKLIKTAGLGASSDKAEANLTEPEKKDRDELHNNLANYVIGPMDTNECPPESEAMDVRRCKEAAIKLRFLWKGTAREHEYPEGCYKWTGKEDLQEEVYFNTRFKGASAAHAQPLCQVRRSTLTLFGGSSKTYLSTVVNGLLVFLVEKDDKRGRQDWTIHKGEGEWHTIKAFGRVVGGRRFLSVSSDGSKISLAPRDDGSGRQRWTIVKADGKEWYNIKVFGGLSGISGGKVYLGASKDGSRLELSTSDDGSGRQRWKVPLAMEALQKVHLVSDGSPAKPHCTSNVVGATSYNQLGASCRWTAIEQSICATAMCAASGYPSGDFVESKNNPCEGPLPETAITAEKYDYIDARTERASIFHTGNSQLYATQFTASCEAGSWYKGSKGLSCEQVCKQEGGMCDSIRQSSIVTPAAVHLAFKKVGANCKFFSESRKNGPFAYGKDDELTCSYLKEGTTSPCTSSQHSNAALCFCTSVPAQVVEGRQKLYVTFREMDMPNSKPVIFSFDQRPMGLKFSKPPMPKIPIPLFPEPRRPPPEKTFAQKYFSWVPGVSSGTNATSAKSTKKEKKEAKAAAYLKKHGVPEPEKPLVTVVDNVVLGSRAESLGIRPGWQVIKIDDVGVANQEAPVVDKIYADEWRQLPDGVYSPNINGGGWMWVRHVPKGSIKSSPWHTATDQLTGTAVYGTPSPSLDDPAWSVDFSQIAFDQFLFATGDETKWLVATKDQVIGDFYNNDQRKILQSSSTEHEGSYMAKWRRRAGGLEFGDPFISLDDYDKSVEGGGILYAENSKSGAASSVLKQHLGANVFIRKDSDKVPYVLGVHGKQECPPGSSRIGDKTLCQAVAKHFQMQWGESPGLMGCYTTQGKDAGFNTKASMPAFEIDPLGFDDAGVPIQGPVMPGQSGWFKDKVKPTKAPKRYGKKPPAAVARSPWASAPEKPRLLCKVD